MKRLGNISQAVETLQNFREAFFDFSRHKKSRLSVQAFEAEFETNLQALLNAYVNQTWHTSDYEAKPVEKPKHRIAVLPVCVIVDTYRRHLGQQQVWQEIL